jgi:hypothetical protein
LVLFSRNRKEGTMKKKEAELQETGKDEMNLVEFPITLLAKRHEPGCKTMKFSDTITGEDAVPIKREWTVTGSDEFGLPLAQDNDVLLALFLLGKEKNFSSPTIHFSRYRLCKILEWDTNCGPNYRRLEESFDRLKGMSIKAKNAFWDNLYKRYVTINFGIFDEYHLYDGKPRKREANQEPLPLSYVRLNNTLYESIKAGYIKSLDTALYFKLESSIAKRLYRYLDKKAYNKKKFEIGLFTLAEVHLGLRLCKYVSQIKQQLDPAHEELVNVGFLKSADYQKTSDGSSEKVVYQLCQQQEELIEGAPAAEPCKDAPVPDDGLLTRLIEIGVTRKVAEQILREYPLEAVRAQVEALPHRKAEDAPAALVSSIMNDWSLPASLKKRKQSQAKVEAEKKQREQEGCQKAEHRAQIEKYLSSLAGEELTELTRQAMELARQEGGTFFRDKELPEYMVNAYVHMMVEKKLGAKAEKKPGASVCV